MAARDDPHGAGLTAFVCERLRQAIREGRYRSGDRLREAEVAQWLGVSRTPVREALNRLISEQLLTEHRARGITVVELDESQVRELYAVRETLEGMAAGLAAVHAGPADIDAMRACLEEARGRFADADAQHALNEHLHNAIRQAAHNRTLIQLLRQISTSLDLLRGTTYELAGRAEQAWEEHRAIVDAIAAHDAAAAEAAARAHLREACRVRLRLVFGPRV